MAMVPKTAQPPSMPLVRVTGAPLMAPSVTRLVAPVVKLATVPGLRTRLLIARVTLSAAEPLLATMNCEPPATRLTVPRVSELADWSRPRSSKRAPRRLTMASSATRLRLSFRLFWLSR